PTQVGGSVRADTGGITEAYVLPVHGQVKVQLLASRHGIAAESDRASARAGCQLFDLEPVARKNERAVDIAERAGQVDVGDRSVLNLKASMHDGTKYWA